MKILKHLMPLIDEPNYKLYWAFCVVAGSWIVALIVSGIVLLMSKKPTDISSQPTSSLTPPIFQRFISESAYRIYLFNLITKNSSTPGELSPAYGNVLDTRLWTEQTINGVTYVILQTAVSPTSSCPHSVMYQSFSIEIPCATIYYYDMNVSEPVVMTVVKISLSDNTVIDQFSWISNAITSAYITPESLYVATSSILLDSAILPQFLLASNTALFDNDLKTKFANLSQLPISSIAKETELRSLLQQATIHLSDDERLQWLTKFNQELTEFKRQHASEIEQTYITRIDSQTLLPLTTKKLSGTLVDRFSMNGYLNTLYVATNDEITILDSELRPIRNINGIDGAVSTKSIQFIRDRGFTIPMREIDPIYVIDLTNPTNNGQLNLSGYSSALYPLRDYLIVGFNRVDNKVKVGIYDVLDASHTQELSSILINEYWSDVATNLEAIQFDTSSETFTITGKKNMYRFAWDPNNSILKLNLIGSSFP